MLRRGARFDEQNAPMNSAELSSVSTAIDELAQRISGFIDEAGAEKREDVAADLLEVERAHAGPPSAQPTAALRWRPSVATNGCRRLRRRSGRRSEGPLHLEQVGGDVLPLLAPASSMNPEMRCGQARRWRWRRWTARPSSWGAFCSSEARTRRSISTSMITRLDLRGVTGDLLPRLPRPTMASSCRSTRCGRCSTR